MISAVIGTFFYQDFGFSQRPVSPDVTRWLHVYGLRDIPVIGVVQREVIERSMSSAFKSTLQ
jgi:hypothetical protein